MRQRPGFVLFSREAIRPNTFRQRIPVQTSKTLLPYIREIQEGKPHVLAPGTIRWLHPTGGSLGVHWIPYTRDLLREFRAALSPWLFNLLRTFPEVQQGTPYWALTLPGLPSRRLPSGVWMGYLPDTAYLGWQAFFFSRLQTLPPSLLTVQDPETFRFQTALHLLASERLSWMSFWSPLWMKSLLDLMQQAPDQLLEALFRQLPKRASRVERALSLPEPDRWIRLWPRLRLISMWGDGDARWAWDHLTSRFPHVHFQKKGLLATEGVVTFPLEPVGHVLAYASHTYEFRDAETEDIVWPWEVVEGRVYHVVLTTGSGLVRYHLGDLVKVEGFYRSLPVLRFVGRAYTTDLAGEKLHQSFVLQGLETILPGHSGSFPGVFLVPRRDPPRYRLYVDPLFHSDPEKLAEQVEHMLQENPPYRQARKLGELQPVEAVALDHLLERYLVWCQSRGQRMGDVKFMVLLREDPFSG